MMTFANSIFLAFGVTSIASKAVMADTAACAPVKSISCVHVSSPPTLDGNTEDWSSVEVFEAPLTGALTSQLYSFGNASIQCVYNSGHVFFLFQIPGLYRFIENEDHKCASISTMFKMGEDATLVNMGGCPLAANCANTPEGCDSYKVDLGGHWELGTTKMGTLYKGNDSTGNDEKANKDDEYAVSPTCRFDDDDEKAANEWEGAWFHTNPMATDRTRAALDDTGSYIFEMSRSLQTNSTETDAQLEAGTAIDFGFAFWDPNESDEGWTDSGHYVTGCSKDWISLRLVDDSDTEDNGTGKEDTGHAQDDEGTGAASFAGSLISWFIAFLAVAYMM